MYGASGFFVTAILDLVISTLILMRGWDVGQFWDSFKSYSVTDIWDLWVLSFTRSLVLLFLLFLVRFCSWQTSSRMNKKKGIERKGKSEEDKDALAYFAEIANMSILSVLVIFIIGKISFMVCYSELITDGTYWHWLMVGESSAASILEYCEVRLAINAIGEKNALKRRHEFPGFLSNGDSFKYQPLKAPSGDFEGTVEQLEPDETAEGCQDSTEKALPDSSTQDTGILTKLEKLRAKRKIIWRLVQMAALDWIWLLLGFIFLLIAALTQARMHMESTAPASRSE